MPERYQISRQLHKLASQVIPGGVSSNNRASWQPHPLFYLRGEGAYVWDVDGHRYIDYVLGRGPLITGHSHPAIIEAIVSQYRQGQFFAGQTELECALAHKIRQLVPGMQMTRFCNSGSEAVHVALRLARSVTGREKIIRFEGHYHGWFDNIAWGFAAPAEHETRHQGILPMSLGQAASDVGNIVSLPWNDADALESALSVHAGEIAAVITEPIMFNSFWSNILPEKGFLSKVRELCDAHQTLLIFDEIQTGFRTSIGGAQSSYGVVPDMSTFAKALGGPVCLGAVTGKQHLMERLSSTQTIHTGTYNAFPPFLAGALAHLEVITQHNAAALTQIHRLSERLYNGLQQLAMQSPLPLQVRCSPGAVTTLFRHSSAKVSDYRTARQQLMQDLTGRWHAALQVQGIRITPEGLWYLSVIHTENDIAQTLEKAARALTELEQTRSE
ncbi:aspartate aminotransferase family protein [Biostraticola tofi]|uniref:Glutamate-1-semialdehyde 2,1-aminomutase n=1 Tax=Biostraticola tofi TaxID=466109 RepID=A0A4R3YZT9_9GAMM|nr:aspartate aminotransferase family protein [Biostraticola tofi]TCV98331.1 glutamate-1-semialdehyde 2,1-aminomutase [Biostraticola tofi]